MSIDCGPDKKFTMKRVKLRSGKVVVVIHDKHMDQTVVLGKADLRNAWKLWAIGD